jgi:probable HAF family extracellular repeat protein
MERTTWRIRFIALAAVVGMPLGISQMASADPLDFVLFQYPGTHITVGNGINSSGQVVGLVAEAPGFTADPIGFLYFAGTFTPIYVPGSTSTSATGINNSGVIVGNSSAGAFLESNGIYTPFLGPGSMQIGANGINNSGQIVGSYSAGAYFYDGSSFHTISVPGSTTTTANGLNNAGKIVGSYTVGSKSFGYIDDAGVFTTISIPGSTNTFATGINNLGEVVGYYSDGLITHGFMYSNGHITTFDAPGVFENPDAPLISVSGINDDGQISGSENFQTSGQEFAFIATPVPEPGTIGLVGAGMMVLAGAVRRKLLC